MHSYNIARHLNGRVSLWSTVRRIILLQSFGLPSPSFDTLAQYRITPTFVFSLEDFEIHTRSHKARVELCVELLAEQFKNKIRVPIKYAKFRTLLSVFTQKHDNGKLNQTLSFLQKHGYDLSKPLLINRLYRFFGIKFATIERADPILAKTLTIERMQTIADLNMIDHSVAQAFFVANNLIAHDGTLNAVAQILTLLENVADTVDRGMSEVSPYEFARKMETASARFSPGTLERNMALYLEKIYYHQMIEHGLLFSQFKPRYVKNQIKNQNTEAAKCQQINYRQVP